MRNFILLIIILILFGFFFLVYNYAPLVDENLHFTQIKRFMFGNYTQDITAVMPGYHFFMSTVSKAFGLNHIGEMRFIQLIISIATILIFFHLVKTLHLPHSRGLMFSSFPLFFPFFLPNLHRHVIINVCVAWILFYNKTKLCSSRDINHHKHFYQTK